MTALVVLLGIACGASTPGTSVSPSQPAHGERVVGRALSEGPAPPEEMLEVTWDAGGLPTGRIAPIEVRAGVPIASVDGVLDGRAVVALPASVDGARWLVLAPVSVEAEAKSAVLTLAAALRDGRTVTWAKSVPIVEAHYEERLIRVAKRFTAPSRKQRIRAEREARKLADVLGELSRERLWRGSFARPTAGGETSPFGTRRTYNGKRRSRHLGLDLDGKVGASIVAANTGRVVLASRRFYSGGTVVVDHGQGLFTMYFHMSRIDVKVGESVGKGQRIGAVGATGQVTGPHLHFSVRLGGLYQDPKTLLTLDLSGDAMDSARSLGPTPSRGGPPEGGSGQSVPGQPRQTLP